MHELLWGHISQLTYYSWAHDRKVYVFCATQKICETFCVQYVELCMYIHGVLVM